MIKYELYDMIVAKTLEPLVSKAVEWKGLAISNSLELEENKYFIEVGKMASNLVSVPFYVNLGFFKFWRFKIKNRKLMKGVKRYKEKNAIPLTSIAHLKSYIVSCLEEEDINIDTIFDEIYEEYYKI